MSLNVKRRRTTGLAADCETKHSLLGTGTATKAADITKAACGKLAAETERS